MLTLPLMLRHAKKMVTIVDAYAMPLRRAAADDATLCRLH